MKRTTLYLIVLLCMMGMLSSCSGVTSHGADSETDTGNSTNETYNKVEHEMAMYAQYFDTDCLEQPTPEAVASISEGMKITDIIEQIGKPHDAGPFSGVPSLEWKMADGGICCIVFTISQEAPKNLSSMEQLMQYGVAYRVIITES